MQQCGAWVAPSTLLNPDVPLPATGFDPALQGRVAPERSVRCLMYRMRRASIPCMVSELWRLEQARIAEERRVGELLTKAIAGREITRLLFAVAASQDMVPPRNGQMPRPPELTRQMPTK